MLTGRRPRAANWRKLGPSLVAFEPLGPVAPGHMLVVPRLHCTPWSAPALVGLACHYATSLAELLGYTDWNLIVSNGAAATQTIEHLHVHLVPRAADDHLTLPWARRITVRA